MAPITANTAPDAPAEHVKMVLEVLAHAQWIKIRRNIHCLRIYWSSLRHRWACHYCEREIWIKPVFTKHHLPFLWQTQRPNQSSCLGRRWLPASVQTPGSRYIQMAKKRRWPEESDIWTVFETAARVHYWPRHQEDNTTWKHAVNIGISMKNRCFFFTKSFFCS